MILSMSDQATVFMTTVLSGFVIGFIYDVFRIFRKMIKHANIIIQLEDIIYWVVVVFFLFFVLSGKNYGEVRGFAILGAFLGMIIYFNTLSVFLIKISTAVINAVKKSLLKKIIFIKKILQKIKKYVTIKATSFASLIKKIRLKKHKDKNVTRS